MVDGSEIGNSIDFNLFSKEEWAKKTKEEKDKNTHWVKHAAQDFRNADMVAIEEVGYSNINVGEPDKPITVNRYNLHAVYGDKVVSVCTSEKKIAEWWMYIEDKIVLVKQKPYILPGD